MDQIKKYNLTIIDIAVERNNIDELAELYIEEKVIPRKKLDDALHIAVSTVFEMDVLLSWNYKHLANINRERKILAVNFNQGYNQLLRICTPLEVMDEKDD